MISKSYEKKRAAFQTQRSGRRQDWQEAGLDEGFWERICFFMDKFSMTGVTPPEWQASTAEQNWERIQEGSRYPLWICLSWFYTLLCSFIPCSAFRFLSSHLHLFFLFFSCTAPPNICLLAFYLSIAPRLPHSRLLPKSFFRSLLLLIIFHSATPLSLCLSFFFHLLCVKSYRVHSSGSLMPVPLCWLHWHSWFFFSFCCSATDSDTAALAVSV